MEEVHHNGGASLVTSRDQIARLVKPTTPYLGHLLVRSRSRRGIEDNEVIFVPVQDNKQCAAYIGNYQVIECNNDPLDTRQSLNAMAVANYSSKQ
jgi:hypothetical protein